MSTFTGFSEEDLKRIKSGETPTGNDQTAVNTRPTKRYNLPKRIKSYPYKTANLQNEIIDDNIDELFDKCRLSFKTNVNDKTVNNGKNYNTTMDTEISTNKPEPNSEIENIITIEYNNKENETENNHIQNDNSIETNTSVNATPDIVRGVNLDEDDMAMHRGKLEELQLKQRLMEEQNKKRKEMLGKVLADRTRQTEEEVLKLDKIKKELQVLDGQFSQDVSVLRKKIDLACLTYSEAEKHYIKVEKEFLQAKIHLQKEKEKKELLTEHLCALITHNETRKAQKLETLMLELATNNTANQEYGNVNAAEPKVIENKEIPLVLDGVDQRTGKMVEFNGDN